MMVAVNGLYTNPAKSRAAQASYSRMESAKNSDYALRAARASEMKHGQSTCLVYLGFCSLKTS
jgi:hypothetical protein